MKSPRRITIAFLPILYSDFLGVNALKSQTTEEQKVECFFKGDSSF